MPKIMASVVIRMGAGVIHSFAPGLVDELDQQDGILRHNVNIRRIQQLLAAPKETYVGTSAAAKVSPEVLPHKHEHCTLDKSALRRMAKQFEHTFQSIASIDKYAQSVERVIQAIVDLRAWDGYRVQVSVTVAKNSS